MIARSVLVIALLLPPLCTGCRKANVESYRVPKEKDAEMPIATAAPSANAGGTTEAPPPSAAPMANTPVPTAEGAELTWTAPREWTQKPPAPMRKATFAIPSGSGDAELSITAFPGDVGGELANVNRWRGQVQLAPITEADLAKEVTRVEHNGLKFGLADVVATGPNPRRILGASVPFGGATWFFKMAGSDAAISAAKPAFLAFLETVKPAAPAAP
jgi:hypothetical protein